MQNLLKAAILVVLAGCSTESPIADLVPSPIYRDTDVPISSIALFDAERYAGTWYEIASYPVPFQADCERTQAVYGPPEDGALALRNSCLKDGKLQSVTGTARVTGPGRLQVRIDAVPFLTAPYWVLWVDEGYRTAVVGVPSGKAGWILNRAPTIPPDRLAAAKDILRFNGYDLTRLRMTPQ